MPDASSFDQTRARLARLVAAHTPGDGTHETAIPGLSLVRLSRAGRPYHGMLPPLFGACVQGRKSFALLAENYVYDPAHYLVSAARLPVVGYTLDATPEVPYLGLHLALDADHLHALCLEAALPAAPAPTGRGLAVERLDEPLLDSLLHLARLLDEPRSLPVLAPLALRELYYRLLTGPQGDRLRQLAAADGRMRRIAGAIRWLEARYEQPVRVAELARVAGMSPSSLHQHFKAVTAMSPLQFQKHLRLQEARRLMLREELDAASASLRVGYESPTQFNREYSRQFGAPPARDVARLRGVLAGVAHPASVE